MRILNSILANGAGLGNPTLQTVIAGINRGTDRMTADPRSFFFYVTALAGDDYDRTRLLPPIHRSAPVALSRGAWDGGCSEPTGVPGPALGSVRILNSILANGAGLLGDPTNQDVIAGIDCGVDRMTADPRSFDGTRFFGGIYNESDLNIGEFHRCYPIAGASSYIASSNRPDDASASRVFLDTSSASTSSGR